ncbi:MAG: hypothetical protein JNK48_16060 [Bryobacterales bacterium]|nr:hypothetical protein [Bryobacterales bacterium]
MSACAVMPGSTNEEPYLTWIETLSASVEKQRQAACACAAQKAAGPEGYLRWSPTGRYSRL